MIITPEALYLQLGRLIADMPNFGGPGPVSNETNAWLGRAAALVDQHGDVADNVSFKVAAQNLSGLLHEGNVQTIKSIVHAALSRAELAAPLSVQGTFIQAGGTFDAFVAFGKAVESATKDVMIVDPYADAKALTDFAVQTPEGVAVRVLADAEYRKGTLDRELASSARCLAPFGGPADAQEGAARPFDLRRQQAGVDPWPVSERDRGPCADQHRARGS